MDGWIRNEYACNIYSFDPLIEADLFKNKRNELQVYKSNKLDIQQKIFI